MSNNVHKDNLFFPLFFLSSPVEGFQAGDEESADVPPGLEWASVFDSALASGTLPLVFNNSVRRYEKSIPENILKIQRIRVSAIVGRNIFLWQRLVGRTPR